MINLNEIAYKIASNDLNVSSIVPRMTIDEYGNKKWRVNGLLHREDGPAVEYVNGAKEWYLNVKIHNENGPALINKNGGKEWCVNGKLHREDGPAIENETGGKEWYLYGKHILFDPETWGQKVLENDVENIMEE